MVRLQMYTVAFIDDLLCSYFYHIDLEWPWICRTYHWSLQVWPMSELLIAHRDHPIHLQVLNRSWVNNQLTAIRHLVVK